MANGLTGLDQGELVQARAAFEAALALFPADPGALEGLARVEAAEQLATIAAHRKRTAALESEERWAEAATGYSAALALDPTLRFARDGLASASARSELNKQLEAHIGRPDRLSETAVLEQARRILVQAEKTDPAGPVLERQIETLGHLITVASTPIVVRLQSDGETEVQIYRVGPLGTFEHKQLELRPGTYTVVGSRKGFRDVRQKLEVRAGTQPTLTVRCEEKI
jgi:tetratricopeptide (TPR) repeat protein